MTTKQRKALQAVVLEAGEIQTTSEFFGYSCLALEFAYRRHRPRALAIGYAGIVWKSRELSTAYWKDLLGSARGEDFETRAYDLSDRRIQEARLLALAFTHTLIGTGDFEAITGYNINNT